MRMPSRLAAALVAAASSAALAVLTGPVAAAEGEARVVGGPGLAGKGVVVGAGAPAPPQVAATSWLVGDLDTGEVLAAKDAHGAYAPASTLKTLTAVALIPELPADRIVRASFADVNVEGSRVGLVEHVDYSVQELFAALLMVSGNDAANVLASTAGGQERTAALMNARAASLHALDTHAVNPHGLDAPGQVSSAYDLALIARAGLADPAFARYVSTVSSSVNAPNGTRIEIRNKNKLLGRYPGALGVKNGYTSAARASFVGAAERDGRRLVVTLMKADPRVFDEAVKLLDWGFAAGSAEPVGELVAPGPAASTRTREAQDGPLLSGTTTSASTAPATARERSTGLPVTLAGLALAAAAVLAVRARPAAAARSTRGRPPTRRPAPRRQAPRRPDERRRSSR